MPFVYHAMALNLTLMTAYHMKYSVSDRGNPKSLRNLAGT